MVKPYILPSEVLRMIAKDRIRMAMDFTPKIRAQIETLAMQEEKTRIEIVCRALHVYEEVMKAKRDGDVLALLRKDGTLKREICFI
jgi:hypothetical protein